MSYLCFSSPARVHEHVSQPRDRDSEEHIGPRFEGTFQQPNRLTPNL